jgi:Aspartyl protease
MAIITVPLQLLSIEGDGFHLQVRVKINGKVANCLIDTGASKTVFDRTNIGRFLKREALHENERLSTGLGTSSMQSQVLFLNKIEIGDYVIRELPCIVLDLSHVNETYTSIGLKAIDGVIGSDLLEDARGIIDYGRKRLTLHTTPARKAKSATAAVREAAPKRAATLPNRKRATKDAVKSLPKVKKTAAKRSTKKR